MADWVKYGYWDLARISKLLPREVTQRLIAILPPLQGAGCDIMVWNGNANGNFTLKSAYFMIEKLIPDLYDPVFKLIWKWKGVEKIHLFIWISIHNRLPTNSWRSSWAGCSSLCQWCQDANEDVIHILRDCTYAKSMWRKLFPRSYYSNFFAANLSDWFTFNLKLKFGSNFSYKWSLIWGIGIWKL